ncbi:MAG TPA: PAS domain S-box protein [Dissulfurispiraceae bacterium]|nr:PAS domain S-box protein [Dissulfurispiraceae bacterium]
MNGSAVAANQQHKVLIVDDDAKTLKLLGIRISKHGYFFETASDGGEAVSKALNANPDIILLDIHMPGISGIETCRQLKNLEKTRHIPVIAITSSPDREDRIGCLEAGANDFVNKPVDIPELLIKIRNLIRLKEFEDIKVKNSILSETIVAIETAKREWEQSMDCISDAVILVNANDNIIRCNKVLSELTGKPMRDILDRNWQDILTDIGFCGFTDEPGKDEFRLESGKWFKRSVYKMNQDEKPGAPAKIITLHDITEQKKAEQNLTKSRDFYLTLFDDFPTLIRRTGLDAKCDYLNKTWLQFTGHALKEELGDSWMDGIHPDDFDTFYRTFKYSFEGKKPFEAEYRLKNYDGEYKWVFDMGRPYFDIAGNFAGYISSCYDISERRQAEEMLRVSEDYFRSFIESSQDCIAHLSADGSFLSMNDAGCKLHGFDDPADVANLSLLDSVVTNRSLVENAVRQASVGESVSIRYMSRVPEGNLWWDAKLTPIVDFDGAIRSILLVSRDITDQKRAEDALAQKNRELEAAYTELKTVHSQILQQEKMASIGQLAAGVAHEINNPMGFIMSNINTLKRYIAKISEFLQVQQGALEQYAGKSGNSDVLNMVDEKKRSLKIDYIREDMESLISESLDGADRVKKIVQDLKSFSRVDEAEYKNADINAGLESTINIVWNELKYKAALVKDYGEIPTTKCRPGQLNQVFMNLLVNAAHAIEKQGEIMVRTWLEGNSICITIADTGCGIAEENLRKIFEPFFTTKEVGKGTGLGLSIAYDIIKKHEGDISVESTVGKGTTFMIRIPVVP